MLWKPFPNNATDGVEKIERNDCTTEGTNNFDSFFSTITVNITHIDREAAMHNVVNKVVVIHRGEVQ